MRTAEYWIEKLHLKAHPEGGYFSETYRSSDILAADRLPDRYPGARVVCTTIYFLITSQSFSSFHRLRSDEVWHFYDGSPIRLYVIDESGRLHSKFLGRSLDDSQHLQVVVPRRTWFAAEVTEPASYALVGCTMAPGFDYDDFELANRDVLIAEYPQHRDVIARLTR